MRIKFTMSVCITLFFVVGFPSHGMTEQPAKLIFYLEGINSFLPGIPIVHTLYVKNPNAFPVYIIHQERGFWYSFRVVESNSDTPIDCHEPQIQRAPQKEYKYEEIPPGSVKKISRYATGVCDIQPGHRYRLITNVYSGVEPEPGKGIEHYWKGEKYIEKEFYVEIPQGIDREVYEKTQGARLADSDLILNRYPTSTYAAWALMVKLYGPDPYNVKQWVNLLHPELLCKEPQLKKADAERNLFLIRIVLQYHPDFPFLNHIKKAEICNLNRLDRRKELIKRLAVYRHDPDPITAHWAQFYYDVFTHGKDK